MQPNIQGKQTAIDLLERTRKQILTTGRIAFAEALLAKGEATADDAHTGFTGGFPVGYNPVALGAVTRPFLNGRMIEKSGYRLSCRKENHAREITVWRMVDQGGVETLLASLRKDVPETDFGNMPSPPNGFLFDIQHHPRCRISDSEVPNVIQAVADGVSRKHLAAKYKVSLSTIDFIASGKRKTLTGG